MHPLQAMIRIIMKVEAISFEDAEHRLICSRGEPENWDDLLIHLKEMLVWTMKAKYSHSTAHCITPTVHPVDNHKFASTNLLQLCFLPPKMICL